MPWSRILLYVATAGALSIIGRTLILGPLPIVVAAIALGGYLLLIGAGVAVPRGSACSSTWSGAARREARGVALTFDDGPSPEHTPRILDLCDEAGVKATFFVIGEKAARHPDLVREIVARGHGLGVHGHRHDRLLALRAPRTVAEDLDQAIAAVLAITGERPAFFRPPVKLTSLRVARALEDFDLTVVGWSVRGLDGRSSARPDRVAARVTRKLRDGAIVLLHDGAERDDFTPASVEALPKILAAMARLDLPGVRLDAWIGDEESAQPSAPAPSTPPPRG